MSPENVEVVRALWAGLKQDPGEPWPPASRDEFDRRLRLDLCDERIEIRNPAEFPAADEYHGHEGAPMGGGSPQLRWALYESAQAACRPTSPDRADYLALKARGLSHTRASLTIARKLARRCFHPLRELGPDALEPVT
jgi:hypothetical protein